MRLTKRTRRAPLGLRRRSLHSGDLADGSSTKPVNVQKRSFLNDSRPAAVISWNRVDFRREALGPLHSQRLLHISTLHLVTQSMGAQEPPMARLSSRASSQAGHRSLGAPSSNVLKCARFLNRQGSAAGWRRLLRALVNGSSWMACLGCRSRAVRAIAIMLCVRCPALIGREEQTAMFTDACASARRGFGRAIVLVGEAGAGKTRLAEHAVWLARETGMTSVVGRAVAETPAVPLRVVSEALLELTRDEPPPPLPSLKGYVPLLAALLPHWRSEEWRPPKEPLLATAEGIFRLLREYGAHGGVLVALEDLHWADTASVAVIRFLVDHIAELAGVLVVTVREGEPGSEVTALLEHAGAQLSSVGRLSDQDVQRMAAACLGVSVVSAEVLAHLWRDAEGLPLLVEDLVGLGASDDPPRRFADVVRARLAQMTPDQQNVLAAAAVLGHRFNWRLLDIIAGLPAGMAAAALHRATASHLVVPRQDGFEFRHALTRDVILHGVATSERQRLALAAAQVLGQEAPTADAGRDFAVARLLLDGGDRLTGARLLLELGRRQLDTGELAVAGAALDQASMLVTGTTELGMLIAYERARAALLTGQSTPASELGGQLIGMVEGRDGALATRTRLLLTRAALAGGRWDDAARELRAARATASSNLAIAAEVAVLEAHVALGRSQAGSLLAAEHLAAHAVGIAREASRDDIQCQALEVLGLCARSRDLDVAASALERALHLAETANLGPERLRVLNELGGVEMLRDAVSDRLERARSEALRQGAIGTAVSIGANLAAGEGDRRPTWDTAFGSCCALDDGVCIRPPGPPGRGRPPPQRRRGARPGRC